MLAARISLTLSRHSSLSFIALGRSSGQQPVSSHSCWYIPLTLFVRVRKGWVGFYCERELETEQNWNILTPHSYGRQCCVFLVLQLLNRRPRDPLWMDFFTASYQQLLWSPNSIGVAEGPFGRVWLSLPHLVYLRLQRYWNSNSNSNCLDFCLDWVIW